MGKAVSHWLGCVFIAASLQGLAAGEVVLRTAAQIGSAPKFDVPGPGNRPVTGLCIDFFRAMEAAQPGLRVVGDQSWLPAVRIENRLVDGSLDIACAISHSPEDEDRYFYVAPALFAFDFKLAARRNDPVDVHDWDDVRKLAPDNRILVNHGWAYADRLGAVPGLHVDDSGPTPEVNLKKLARSHGRFFYFRDPGFQTAIEAAKLCDQVRVLPAVFEHTDAYLIASRHLPPPTIEQLHRVIARLQANGELDRILAERRGDGEGKCGAGDARSTVPVH